MTVELCTLEGNGKMRVVGEVSDAGGIVKASNPEAESWLEESYDPGTGEVSKEGDATAYVKGLTALYRGSRLWARAKA